MSDASNAAAANRSGQRPEVDPIVAEAAHIDARSQDAPEEVAELEERAAELGRAPEQPLPETRPAVAD